jgi:DNA-binding ferritin-like protein (Dps family)
MEYSVSEFDDVVIFKQIIDKYTWMRSVDLYSRMKKTLQNNHSLLERINESIFKAEEQINSIGDNVHEFYKLLINDQIFEAEKKS